MTDEVTAKAMGGGKDIHLAPRSAERTQGEDFEQSPNYDANYWTPDSTGWTKLPKAPSIPETELTPSSNLASYIKLVG
jgi:hypothetical protein